jgi:hypothetical protein
MAILPHCHILKLSRCLRSTFQSVQVLTPRTSILQEITLTAIFGSFGLAPGEMGKDLLSKVPETIEKTYTIQGHGVAQDHQVKFK